MSQPAQQNVREPADPVGYIRILREIYSAGSPNNSVGADYREWTQEHYSRFSLPDLLALRVLIVNGNNDVWNFMPSYLREGRSEGEARFLYQNMILREVSNRSKLHDLYEAYIQDGVAARFNVPTARVDMDTPVTVERGTLVIVRDQNPATTDGYAQTQVRPITAQPEDILARDMAEQIYSRSGTAEEGVVQAYPELMTAILRNSGIARQGTFYGVLTDPAIFDLGFTVGAKPEIANIFPADVRTDRATYRGLAELGARLGSGVDVPDDEALIAGIIAGVISRTDPGLVNETTVYPPR